jgi:hypothetical protein
LLTEVAPSILAVCGDTSEREYDEKACGGGGGRLLVTGKYIKPPGWNTGASARNFDLARD